MPVPARFILVDDDPVNNLLCQMVIKRVADGLDIQTFNLPITGFEYLVNEYSNNSPETFSILLLDINMPIWSGWDFLDNYNMLDEYIKKQIRIYMLSSSLDTGDRRRAAENPNVVDYFVKPLTPTVIKTILETYIQ